MTKRSKLYIGLIAMVFTVAISMASTVSSWTRDKELFKVDAFILIYALSIGLLAYKAVTNLNKNV